MTSYDDLISDYTVAVDEHFNSATLDETTWLPYYLPQWAGRDASQASYRLTEDRLQLFIAADQPPWMPNLEGNLRVSSLQTGCYAGPTGSLIGQHRHRDELRVVEEQPTLRLATLRYGAVEMKARWQPVADQMVALWMIGFEDEPHRSAEICICEIFGSEATATTARVGAGVHPFGDPTIIDDFDKVRADIDVSEWHHYSVVWTPNEVHFFLDGTRIKYVEQAPQYEMQLMLNIYDFAQPGPDRPTRPFEIDQLRILNPPPAG